MARLGLYKNEKCIQRTNLAHTDEHWT